MNAVLERRWSVREAAQLLGVSERHTWRMLAAYREGGAAVLAHGNRDRLPPNATSATVQAKVIALARERYQGVNHTHLTELLAQRDRVVLSRSTVRRLLVGAGMPSPRHRRPPRHRCRRERMPQEGMLVQVDGSPHRWLEERGPWLTLLLAVDDATGNVPYALFREQEDTVGYFRLMTGIIQRRGIPLALYSDRHVVFRHPSPTDKTVEAPLTNKGKLTQFGRAMRELGVTHVFAHSPEAKGRVERANGTFQDRLVAELRLAGAITMEEANSVLEAFLPRFNERFGVPSALPELAYREVPEGMDIDGVLCLKEQRKVAKDNTVQYRRRTLQLFPGSDRPSYAGVHVEVQERLDGRLMVNCCGKLLTPGEAPLLAARLRALADTPPVDGHLGMQADMDVPAMVAEEYTEADNHRMCPGWDGDWYRDESKKCLHGKLVRAGMERARLEGKHIGRPKVTEREGFMQRFKATVEHIRPGGLSRRQAARELGIGYATLKRLLDTSLQLPDKGPDTSPPPAVAECRSDEEVCIGALH